MGAELMTVNYESLSGIEVTLTPDTVKNYLTRGNGKITDQEVAMFLRTCQAKRLDPLENGEIWLIKYDDRTPAQMVVGYHAYVRRAERFPDYRGYKAGIVVLRKGNDEPIYKEGSAIYKALGETLIGGWCKVYRDMHGTIQETYSEVSMDEYSTGKSNWVAKPGTMIRKVAIAQAFRGAFPNEYEGLYTEDEMSTVTPQDKYVESSVEELSDDRKATQEEKQKFLAAIAEVYSGKEECNRVFNEIKKAVGIQQFSSITVRELDACMVCLKELQHGETVDAEDNPEEGENNTDGE